jgi:hypothetical protein
VRRLGDNTLCIARHTSHADLRVDPLAFLRCGPLGNSVGHRLRAALSAVVEVHAEETQFRGLIIVLIILALVILPLTVTIAALVEEPLSLRQRIQSGELDFGQFFQQPAGVGQQPAGSPWARAPARHLNIFSRTGLGLSIPVAIFLALLLRLFVRVSSKSGDGEGER